MTVEKINNGLITVPPSICRVYKSDLSESLLANCCPKCVNNKHYKSLRILLQSKQTFEIGDKIYEIPLPKVREFLNSDCQYVPDKDIVSLFTLPNGQIKRVNMEDYKAFVESIENGEIVVTNPYRHDVVD